ncbi:MAG TPA: extracellular solute-binding protein [Anaerolineaceae bacterium]|nr:extracellular solute-binding protein [Anaerolineaceae bacterium]
MFKHLRKLPAFLFLLLTLSLSGCQAVLDRFPFLQSSPTPEPTVQATSPAVFEPTSTPEMAATEPEIISIWLPPQFDPNNNSAAGNLMKAQMAAFSDAYPEVKLEVRLKAVQGSGGLMDSLMTASAAAPDVVPGLILLPRADFEQAALTGLLLPVEPSEFPLKDEEYFPFALEMVELKDLRYGLPFSGDLLVFAYNSQQIGFPPRTLSSLYQQKSITTFPGADRQGLIPLLSYLNAGGTLELKDNVLSLQEKALLSALEWVNNGVNNGLFPFSIAEMTDFDQSFASLQSAQSTYAFTWASRVLDDSTNKYSFNSLPSDQATSFTLADGWVLAFPQASTARHEHALNLARLLTSPVFQQTWSEAAGVVPVSSSILTAWKDKALSGILLPIAASARMVPSQFILGISGPLLSQATQELIRQQVTTIEASNKILEALKQ